MIGNYSRLRKEEERGGVPTKQPAVPSRRPVTVTSTSCSMRLRFSLLAHLFLFLPCNICKGSLPDCPCEDVTLCETIQGPPVRPKEIFGFTGTLGMNWTHITTVAWVTDEKLVCKAHQHGVRAILAAPSFDLETEMQIPERRAAWIKDALNLVRSKFADGLVFDYESPQPAESAAGHAYARLIAETRRVFQAVNPSYQISTCVPWSPDSIDGRDFPWLELADASDLLYVMDYDTRSQIFDACIASANAPFPGMVRGIQRFFDLGIEPNKLVLGVPWYGYKYKCLPGTLPDAIYCPIQRVPFRGVDCSDAAGTEVPYSTIVSELQSTNASITGGLRRDANMDAPFFNVVGSNGTVYQFWYDDAASLRRKYTWARKHNLRGVGPYTFSDLDPNGRDTDVWSAFDVFLQDDDDDDMPHSLIRKRDEGDATGTST